MQAQEFTPYMKKILWLIPIAVWFCVPTARADDIVLIDGRVFREAAVFSQTATSVTIRHAGGLASVGKELLPPELRALYPIDEARALAEERRLEAARKAAKEQAAADAERAERVRKQAEESAAAKKASEEHAAAVEDAAYAEVERAIRSRAAVYFDNEYSSGNNSATSVKTVVELSEVRPVDGWPGRWFAKGRAFMKFYQSQGRTFTSQSRDFEVFYSREGRKTNFEITVR